MTLIILTLAVHFLPTHTRISVTQPLRNILLAPLGFLNSWRGTLVDLRAENARLSARAARLAVDNARLRTLVRMEDLPLSLGTDYIRCPIVARDMTTLERYLVLGQGAVNGVRSGAPVLVADGVVGKVVEVGERQALVQTILDPESRVAVTNLRSRVLSVAGSAGRGMLRLHYVPKHSDFAAGDTIVTAGLGDVFPRSLRIGVVRTVSDRPTELFMSIAVEPLASIAVLEHVFVLVLREETGPGSEDNWLETLDQGDTGSRREGAGP